MDEWEKNFLIADSVFALVIIATCLLGIVYL